MSELETTTGAETRLNASQSRLIHVAEVLAAHPIFGLPAAEVRAQVGDSRNQVARTLATLEAGDWAEQTPAGRWRLTPRLTQIADRMRQALADICHLYLGGTP